MQVDDGSWGFATQALDLGDYARRRSWPEGQWIKLEPDHDDDGNRIMGIAKLCPRRGRSQFYPSWEDIQAKDWQHQQQPMIQLPFSEAELAHAATAGHTVHFRPHLDRLQTEGFLVINGPPPEGWEYATVSMAVRRIRRGS